MVQFVNNYNQMYCLIFHNMFFTLEYNNPSGSETLIYIFNHLYMNIIIFVPCPSQSFALL